MGGPAYTKLIGRPIIITVGSRPTRYGPCYQTEEDSLHRATTLIATAKSRALVMMSVSHLFLMMYILSACS